MVSNLSFTLYERISCKTVRSFIRMNWMNIWRVGILMFGIQFPYLTVIIISEKTNNPRPENKKKWDSAWIRSNKLHAMRLLVLKQREWPQSLFQIDKRKFKMENVKLNSTYKYHLLVFASGFWHDYCCIVTWTFITEMTIAILSGTKIV